MNGLRLLRPGIVERTIPNKHLIRSGKNRAQGIAAARFKPAIVNERSGASPASVHTSRRRNRRRTVNKPDTGQFGRTCCGLLDADERRTSVVSRIPVILRVEDCSLRLSGNPPELIRSTAASVGNVHYQRGAGITCHSALHPVTASIRSRVARRIGHLPDK